MNQKPYGNMDALVHTQSNRHPSQPIFEPVSFQKTMVNKNHGQQKPAWRLYAIGFSGLSQGNSPFFLYHYKLRAFAP